MKFLEILYSRGQGGLLTPIKSSFMGMPSIDSTGRLSDLGMSNNTPDDALHSVCDPQLPDAGDVWDGVVDQVDQWWEELAEAV